MKEKLFSKLLASIKEAGQLRVGRKQPGRIFKIDPSSIKAVRRKLHLSQSEFALIL